jgi:hypothetical protein
MLLTCSRDQGVEAGEEILESGLYCGGGGVGYYGVGSGKIAGTAAAIDCIDGSPFFSVLRGRVWGEGYCRARKCASPLGVILWVNVAGGACVRALCLIDYTCFCSRETITPGTE